MLKATGSREHVPIPGVLLRAKEQPTRNSQGIARAGEESLKISYIGNGVTENGKVEGRNGARQVFAYVC